MIHPSTIPDLVEIAAGLREGSLTPEQAADILKHVGRPTAELRAERDRLIRQFLTEHCHGMSARAAAFAFLRVLRRYRAAGWPAHRHHVIPPPHLDAQHRIAWEILASGAPVPESINQIVAISKASVTSPGLQTGHERRHSTGRRKTCS